MQALIDGDIIPYEFGNSKAIDGVSPLSWPFVVSRVQARVNKILDAVNATSYTMYLTGTGNFREGLATIKPYKGNRPEEKPYWHEHIRNFLVDQYGAIIVDGMEADDALSIEQIRNYSELVGISTTVICSRDKDLDMVPGYHYSWEAGNQKEKPLWLQTRLEGLKCMYCQMLTGDTVDNIPGLFGVGKSSTLLKKVHEMSTEEEMSSFVLEEYVKRFGNWAPLFYTENMNLLRMLEHESEINIHCQ